MAARVIDRQHGPGARSDEPFDLAGSMSSVAASTSAKTGRPPRYTTQLAVAANVSAGTITSSPGPMARACIAACKAAVPLETATASRAYRRGERSLEFGHLRTGSQPVALQNRGNGGDVSRVDSIVARRATATSGPAGRLRALNGSASEIGGTCGDQSMALLHCAPRSAAIQYRLS